MSRVACALFVGGMLTGGCGIVAGIQDIAYVDPDAAVEPTEPTPSLEAGSTGPGDDDDDADAGVLADAASDGADGGGGPLCAPADFVDRTLPEALRVVTFPDRPVPAPGYLPRCLLVKAAQTVTFGGSFAAYPLAPRGITPGNPIKSVATGTTASFVFPKPGTFYFGSPNAPGMVGAVEVHP